MNDDICIFLLIILVLINNIITISLKLNSFIINNHKKHIHSI